LTKFLSDVREMEGHRLRFTEGFIVSTTYLARLLFCFAFSILLPGSVVGQEPPAGSPPVGSTAPAPAVNAPSPAPPSPSAQTKDNSSDNGSGTSNDRLFFALPNFLTLENSAHVTPLTAGEKFKVVARSSFDPVQFVWYGFLSGISQAEDSEPGFGQGMAGYGKRYGAAFADGTIENFMTQAALPSIFRQDPRFFQDGQGGFLHRAGYSVSRIVITRTDSGHHEFNFSEVLGSAMAAGISTYSYHPKADRTPSNTASVWASMVAYDTLTITLKEFWPDIRRKLRNKK
jgi:hypothetical protein